MDTHSSSDGQIINEELNEALPTRKALPYQSLLSELDNLIRKDESSFIYGRSHIRSDVRHQIRTLKRELRFQQMVFMFLKNFIFSNYEAINYIQTIAETEAEKVEEAAAALKAHRGFQNLPSKLCEWNFGISKFLDTIDKKIKPHLKEFFLGIVNQLLQGNSSSKYDISEFIDIILLKLKDLQISKPNMIVPVSKQMEILAEMLPFVCIIVGKETNLDVNSQNFLVYFRPWINIAAALVILYWVDEKDEEPFVMVSSSLQKPGLSILELAEAYIVVIKALKPSNVSEILVMREAVGRFTNIILENLIVSIDDRFEILRGGLTLWIALLMDPPQADAKDEKLSCSQTNLLVDEAESLIHSLCLDKLGGDIAERNDEKLICAQINLLVGEAESSIRSLCLDKLGGDVAEKNDILLNEFLEKMNKAKTEVRQLHVVIPEGLSWNSVPRTNGRGFFDFLLGNLQKKLEFEANMFPFEKHLIAVVHEELSILRTFLTDGLQDEHEELRDIWVQASNVAYLVDYVTDSCLSSTDAPVWSNLMHLSNAIEKIQFVKTQVSKFRTKHQVYKNRVLSAKVNSKFVIPKQQEANETTKDDVKVGFADEEQRIIDQLTAGEVGLHIVGIVGMGGQGKTTLAQRVFQDSHVQLCFNKYAWCCISQAYDTKEILLDILKNVGESLSQKQVAFVSHEELAHRLYKCLKGRRYLVVLDDVWDAKAWHELKLSFPDDNNGSRILLTSRNQNVPLEANPRCCIVELHPLSYEESWNLLQMKVFENDFCPPSLSNIGRAIAENCKGLPLAIVVVAGLLEKDKNVDSWKQISESLKSQLASEGCMNILDLSYKYLSDYLKPCFLYVGAFREDQIIDAKRLTQLWIAEGFVKNDGMKSMEVVANEYLIELVARSLIFVAKRSSRNRIRECRVHDLLRQLCLIKAEEERFLLVPNVSDHSSRLRNGHYRLCIHGKWELFADSEPFVPNVRSFLFSGSGFNSPSAPCFWKRFKLLRVLNLSNAIVSRSVFDEITQFIHLRFLSVACDFPIPSSIVNLFRLEVLHLSTFGIAVLPSVVMKMENLRHIFASSCRLDYTEDFDEMELRLSTPLTNLETFTSFDFLEESSFERVAEKLPNILKLGLTLTFPVGVRLSSYFKKLESLNLCILRQPISPSTLDFPSTLKKLNLSTLLRLSHTMVSSFGKLSNLEVLKLHAHFEDETWNVEDDEFLQLKYLEFGISLIQDWNVSDDSFPCLEQLVIKECLALQELPGRFGAINTLKRIEVRGCSRNVSNSFQQIVDDQMDSGNENLQYSIS